jgi:hypothetical protein
VTSMEQQQYMPLSLSLCTERERERETTLVVNGVMTMHLQSIRRVARDQLLMQTSFSIAIAPFPGLLLTWVCDARQSSKAAACFH